MVRYKIIRNFKAVRQILFKELIYTLFSIFKYYSSLIKSTYISKLSKISGISKSESQIFKNDS